MLKSTHMHVQAGSGMPYRAGACLHMSYTRLAFYNQVDTKRKLMPKACHKTHHEVLHALIARVQQSLSRRALPGVRPLLHIESHAWIHS